MSNQPTVFLVEDDLPMRESLVWLLKVNELQVEAFASPGELLEVYDPDRPGCMIIDLQLPRMSGLELYKALQDKGCCHPFLVISGHGDVTTAVDAMRNGAIDFLEKPFDHDTFLLRVNEAVERDAKQREVRGNAEAVQERIETLTPREHEVMRLVAEGQLTKQIAKNLGISTKTVEVHRSHVTKKMKVHSVAQLVAMLNQMPESTTATQ